MTGSNTSGNVLGASTAAGTSGALLANTGNEILGVILMSAALVMAAIVVTVFLTKKAAVKQQ